MLSVYSTVTWFEATDLFLTPSAHVESSASLHATQSLSILYPHCRAASISERSEAIERCLFELRRYM